MLPALLQEGPPMTTFATPTETVPGYLTGTWDLDPSHSEVAFSVRHLMLSKVRAGSPHSRARSSPLRTRPTPTWKRSST